MHFLTRFAALSAALMLAGCGSVGNSGKYYQNDGPPTISVSTSSAGATPKVESFYKASLRPYTVMGKRYTPVTTDIAMKQTGIGSWYGKQFHGNKTSIGETYDMYAMTAAHTTMPLPSYARVTNLDNGKSVIVRVNDRGPFLHNRIIDLSYAAANELGYVNKGTARVEVVRLTNAEIASGTWRSYTQTSSAGASTPSTPGTGSNAYPVTTPASGWGVQVGSFAALDNAEKFGAHTEAVLSSRGYSTVVRIVRDGSLYRVIVGRNFSHERASREAQTVKSMLGVGAFAIQR